MELITLVFVLAALIVPYYFSSQGLGQSPREIQQSAAVNGLHVGQDMLSTQFGFLWALGILALYVFHIVFSTIEVNRVTASPHHLLAPCIFAVIAYHRIDAIPNLQDTALSMIDGTITQMATLVLAVALITSILCRLRTYRYLTDFDDVQWDVVSKSPYDASYLQLILQLRPLLYAPRRYRACSEGILVEGWFYAMPIGFDDIAALSIVNSSSAMGNGMFYSSSSRHLIRIELHDSLKPTFISPQNREEFARYCVQHIARKRPTRKASPTRHGMLHASDTHAALDKDNKSSNGTRNGARATSASTTDHSLR